MGGLDRDNVNDPNQYTQGGVECIDAIEAALGAERFAGYCAGNVIKYVWRYRDKNGVEDLKKARWYLDRLIANAEGGRGILGRKPRGAMRGVLCRHGWRTTPSRRGERQETSPQPNKRSTRKGALLWRKA